MGMSIVNNLAALDSLRNLLNTSRMMTLSMEKLSSGFRINRASDDPAGLVISEQFRAQIAGLNRKMQIISVAGNNAALRRRVGRLKMPAKVKLLNRGYVTNIEVLMRAADLVITKPGGLTTSECFASSVGMVIIAPIPGQEERNADYILERGAGIKAHNLEELEFKLTHLLGDSAAMTRMKENAFRAAEPYAAFNIANSAVR